MIPLFSVEQVRSADEYAVNSLKIPSIVLMENAARSIFQNIFSEFPGISEIGIVCGKGNNGGDGFAAARHFVNNGFNVKIITLSDEGSLQGDALTNYLICREYLNKSLPIKIYNYSEIKDINKLSDCDLIIDAMLGTGAKGKLKEPYESIVKRLNNFPSMRVAIDVPTGLDLTNSTAETVFNADLTVTLAELKQGFFYGEAVNCAGMVVKGDIGIGNSYFEEIDIDTYLIEPEDAVLNIPAKLPDIHKYKSGKVLTIGGSGNLPGAAVLTVQAALNSGAGASILAFPKSIKQTAQSRLSEAVLFPFEDENKEYLLKRSVKELNEKINWADCIAIGPGLGREEETISAVVNIIRKNKDKIFVIDADAIFAVSSEDNTNTLLNGNVITPHYGEFAQLIGVSAEEVKSNTLKLGSEFAMNSGAYLVLKNAPTIIFSPSGEKFINSAGNPGMAKFGTGDVLTGIIASFIAQSGNVEQSLISAVYIHSFSADLIAEQKTVYGISASEISENIPHSIKFLRDSIDL